MAQAGDRTATVLVVLHHDLVRTAIEGQGGAVGGRSLVDPLVDHPDAALPQLLGPPGGGHELREPQSKVASSTATISHNGCDVLGLLRRI